MRSSGSSSLDTSATVGRVDQNVAFECLPAATYPSQYVEAKVFRALLIVRAEQNDLPHTMIDLVARPHACIIGQLGETRESSSCASRSIDAFYAAFSSSIRQEAVVATSTA